MSQLLLYRNWQEEMENSNHDLSDVDETDHLFQEVKKNSLSYNHYVYGLLLVCFQVKWAPCHCGMAHAHIVHEGMTSRYGG
jgi:hypothetical protein